MKALALVLALMGCTKVVAVPEVRYERYALERFHATVYGSTFATRDTTANRYTLELTGAPTAGAIRADGEWWVTVSSPYGTAVGQIIGGPTEGVYAVWGDTLRLDRTGWWLDLLSCRVAVPGLVCGYDDGNLAITTTWSRE